MRHFMIGPGYRTSARKKRTAADEVSLRLNWLVNMTFVPMGVQKLRSGEADRTIVWPGAAVTVTYEVALVRWILRRNGLGSFTLPRRMPLPWLVTQTSLAS